MKDIIYNRTETKFGFFDILKLLIGGKCVTNLQIEVTNEVVYVEKTTAKSYVEYPEWINRIRIRKQKNGFGDAIMPDFEE